jgi:hypothetical protein
VDANLTPGKLANEVAEAILSAIFGSDLIGCKVSPEAISPLIQQALDAHAKKEGTVNALFLEVLQKIQSIATPPERSQVNNPAHLAAILGERADAILQITAGTLQAWEKLRASDANKPRRKSE